MEKLEIEELLEQANRDAESGVIWAERGIDALRLANEARRAEGKRPVGEWAPITEPAIRGYVAQAYRAASV